ncbi:MAG: sulfotransferase family 2 domain-containing protein [Acidocella sp.]|nr:sulfotransferase family 2 domain-containing protein [Acidocella sp.]
MTPGSVIHITDRMAVVFFHIPRTGGSSLWHSLSRLAGLHQIPAYDLYDHSRILTGSPYHTLQALADLMPRAGQPHAPGIFHHHTRQNITAILSTDEHQYVTIIRDPVERLVSEISYLHSLIGSIPKTSPEFLLLTLLLSPETIAALFDPTVTMDDLLLRVAVEPFYKNYYINSFWQLLFGDTSPKPPRYETMPDAVIPALADVVIGRFAVVNHFPDIAQTYADTAKFMAITEIGEVNRVPNGAPETPLKDETYRYLREVNAAEYRFIDLLKAGSLARKPSAAALSYEFGTISARAESLSAQLKAMRESNSWRLTRPLRRLRGVIG